MNLIKQHVLESAKAIHETQWLKWVQGIFFLFLALHLAQPVLTPLSFALLVSFVLYPVCHWFERRGFGRMVSIIMSLLLLLIFSLAILYLLLQQIIGFSGELPALQDKFQNSVQDLQLFLRDYLGISTGKQESILRDAVEKLGDRTVDVVRSFIAISTFSLLMIVLIPVYVVLILYYRASWMEILHRLFPLEDKQELRTIVNLTIGTYHQFIKGMAIVYLIVGLLNSLGLLLLGVPHPFLFGFVASVLTFIPYLGILAGSLLPIAMAWITTDSILYPIGVIGVFTFVQYLEANLIFPFAVSQRLNVNALVMLLSIFFGGLIWGVAGMILFVPFVGIIKLIADHNPRWKTVSMILGAKDH